MNWIQGLCSVLLTSMVSVAWAAPPADKSSTNQQKVQQKVQPKHKKRYHSSARPGPTLLSAQMLQDACDLTWDGVWNSKTNLCVLRGYDQMIPEARVHGKQRKPISSKPSQPVYITAAMLEQSCRLSTGAFWNTKTSRCERRGLDSGQSLWLGLGIIGGIGIITAAIAIPLLSRPTAPIAPIVSSSSRIW